MGLSRLIILSFLILSLVSSLLSIPLEKSLDESLLADTVNYHLADAGPRSKDFHSQYSSTRPLVPTADDKILHREARTITLLDRLWEAARPPPESARQHNWHIYYKITPKVLYANEQIPKIKALAHAVAKLGYEFSSMHYTPEGIEEHILPCIHLSHSVLELDSLGLREKIWVVGVLSCLKWKIPTQKGEMKGKVFRETPASFRGDLEVFLLKDQPLGEILENMWPHFLTDLYRPDHGNPVCESLQRASLADSVLNHMTTSTTTASTEFQDIQKSFLNLRTPIDDIRASNFMDKIANQLTNIRISPWNTRYPDEEKGMIQFLLHMQEYHLLSRTRVLELIRQHNMGGKVLKVDIGLQLQDKSLDGPSKRVYELLKNIQIVNTESLKKALKEMIHEVIPVHHWGRLLRILEVSTMQNPHIHNVIYALLSESEEITEKFASMLYKLYPIRQDPDCLHGSRILALISKQEQDLIGAKYREKLEKELISKGILSAQTIEPISKVLKWNFKGNRRPELTHYLQTICVQILSHEKTLDLLKPSDTIIEYILHIISLKNNDKKLLQYLYNEYVSTEIYLQALEMIKELNKKSTDHTFEFHLQQFEKYLQEEVEGIIFFKMVNQHLYSTRLMHA